MRNEWHTAVTLLNIIKDDMPEDKKRFYGPVLDDVIRHFTPQRPLEVSRHRYNAFTAEGIMEGMCPRCMGDVTEKDGCCRRCGQALDWEDSDG